LRYHPFHIFWNISTWWGCNFAWFERSRHGGAASLHLLDNLDMVGLHFNILSVSSSLVLIMRLYSLPC